MTAPDAGYAPDPAAIVSAADVLRAHMQREAPDVAALMFNADFEGLAMALDEAGRLLPADAEPDLWQYGYPDLDEPDGLLPLGGTPRVITPRMVRRPMRAVGPWLPAPTDTEESA